jgi:hypothetical protein
MLSTTGTSVESGAPAADSTDVRRAYSSGCRQMARGWRPASNQPPATATTGSPATITSTSIHGTWANVAPRLPRAYATTATTANPSTEAASAITAGLTVAVPLSGYETDAAEGNPVTLPRVASNRIVT